VELPGGWDEGMSDDEIVSAIESRRGES